MKENKTKKTVKKEVKKEEKTVKKVSKAVKEEKPVKKVVKKETTKEKTPIKKASKVVKEEKPVKKVSKIVKEEKSIKEKKSKTVKEEKKEVLLGKKEQKAIKVLSKIISIISKILRICSMIAVPFLLLTVILIPLVFSKVEVNGNIIRFDDVRFVLKDDYITANVSDKTYLIADNIKDLDSAVTFLNSNSLEKIVTGIELTVLFVAIILIINIYLLQYTEKLFKNIYSKKTPFIKENCNYIHNIGRIMIIMIITSAIFETILAYFTRNGFAVHFTTYSVLAILVVYIIYYIFVYATIMQEKSNTVIYD